SYHRPGGVLMCLQDILLMRPCLIVRRGFNVAGASNEILVNADPSRIGFVITGPSSTTIDIRAVANGESGHVVRRVTNAQAATSNFMYADYGAIVTAEWYYNTGGANAFNVFE